ncbi:hypothetical protein FIU85_18040 [Roseovarius sp. THAF8]|uniref:AAA family ATPase n=1 Tax=Roseovarius sp. THAF8 TaxID=2587846 RepID=UPI00126873C5|nr:AAA family ATPase [Roseovarius sp. THAF8]QFT99222.1 hypothetical protein FIU85_18040 [Roseovarius sp. THAF8]
MTTTPLHPLSNSAPTITKAGEFVPKINVPFIVKDLFKPGEVGMIAGAPGLGKSTITAAIAAHAAQGRNFGGLSVSNAVVIYYAAEDAYGVLCRAHPYMRDPAWNHAPFYVVHGAPNLLDADAPGKIARFVSTKQAEHGCDQALVIFDTLNRCIGEADENSSSVMGTVVGNATSIAQSTNSSVVIVHHTGHANPDRPRGSSAFHGNVDCLCLLSKAAETGSEKVALLNAVKQKNGQKLPPLPFKLSALEIGTDREGCTATVPMAIPMEPNSFASDLKHANDNGKPSRIGPERRKDIERVLTELAKSDPASFYSPTEIAARSGSVFNDVRGSDSLRKAVSRALEALVKAKKAERGQNGYRCAHPVSTAGVATADE